MIRTTVRPRARAQIELSGNVEWKLFNPFSGHEDVFKKKNLVVDDGIDLVRDLIGGTGHRPSHIGLGTGTTAVLATDTSIETEQFRGEITRRDDISIWINYSISARDNLDF